MKQDRFLLGILAGIGLLVIVALISFFVRRDSLAYGPEEQPEGVVRNYLVALRKGDYERAYGYLAAGQYKPTLEEFQQAIFTNQVMPEESGVEVGQASISDQQAYVKLSVYHGASGPFDNGWRNDETATLKRENGQWKIESLPYPFWAYSWYQQPPQ